MAEANGIRKMAEENGSANGDPRKLPYFQSEFKFMEDVVRFLSNYVQTDGAFILRTSLSDPNQLTLSICHDTSIKHIQITKKNGQYRLTKRPSFKTVGELVDHYKTHPVPNLEQVHGVMLKVPINGREYVNMEVKPKNIAPQKEPVAPAAKLVQESPDLRKVAKNDVPLLRQEFGGKTSSSEIPEKRQTAKGMLEVIAARPPLSPPRLPEECLKKIAEARASPDYSRREYSYARPLEVDHSTALIQQLKSGEKCECGLYLMDAQLPTGWTVHRVMDSDRKPDSPRLFYVGPDNESSWKLPEEVKAKLSPNQQHLIKFLRNGSL